MSSGTEAVKNKAEGDLALSEEKTTKKIKIDDSSDNNNQQQTTASDKQDNNGSSTENNAVPSKAVNGTELVANDKPSSVDLDDVEGDLNDDEYDDENDNDDEEEDLDEEDDEESYSHDDETGDGVNNTRVDPAISKSLEQVEKIQVEICGLNEKASEEILKVEQKFNKLRRPHFETRNELLKSIPNFWLTALANHPIIAPMIESAEDENCLNYLISLDVEEFEDIKSGYKLTLQFKENPYFTNKDIVKEFQIMSSEEVVSTSTPIEFKNTNHGKKLKQVVEESITQNERSRRPGQTQQSFFAWLMDSTDSGADEISDVIKDQIWPNPLQFFFSPPVEYDVETDEEDDSDEDEDIDDEELDDSMYPCGEYIEGEEPDEEDDDEDDEEDEDAE